MEMRYGVLADYATSGARGKRVIVGVWDTFCHVGEDRPIRIPRCFLAAAFDASALEGSEHVIQLRVTDADGIQLLDRAPELAVRFVPRGPGRPLRADVEVELIDLAVPDQGEYVFEFYSGTERVGAIEFYVVGAPTTPPEPAP